MSGKRESVNSPLLRFSDCFFPHPQRGSFKVRREQNVPPTRCYPMRSDFFFFEVPGRFESLEMIISTLIPSFPC